MKKLSIIALSTTLMSMPAFAQTAHNTTNSMPNQTTDLSVVFNDTENLQVLVLSEQEMAETQGARVPHNGGGLGFGPSGGVGFGSGFGKKLGDLGNGKVGQKLGDLGNGKIGNYLGNYQSSVGKSVSKETYGIYAATGAITGLADYTSKVPANQRTVSGYTTSMLSGSMSGVVTASPVGRVRSFTVGTSIHHAGTGTAAKYMRTK